jgi:hypothetical protein
LGDLLPLDPPFADKLFFENTNNVLEPVSKIYRLTLPVNDANAVLRLPAVAFLWGGFQFYGIITSLKTDFLIFDSKGDPRRAKVSITMNGRAFHKPRKIDDVYNMPYTAPQLRNERNTLAASMDSRLEKILKGR